MVAHSLIGRTAELETLERVLAAEGTRGLLLEGTAGIGKTRLWQEGIELARERRDRILVTRPAGADRQFAFAGLADLLGSTIDDVIPRLPTPQRRALEVALLLRDPEGERTDERAVAASFLSCLRYLARAEPLVLAVDDLQWLDRESSQLLGFALQRLVDERIALLATVRVSADEREPAEIRRALGDTLTRLQLEPMSLGSIFELLRNRLDLKLARPILLRVYEASGGNPFYALELGRALRASGEPKPGEPLPLPPELAEVVRQRLMRLSPSASEALLFAASLSRPTFTAVQLACGSAERAESDLTEARDADILEFEGDVIRFTHPLLASTHYGSTTPWERRAAHGRLAATVDDPEERARHLALSAVGPDERTARALEQAAERAGRRGARAAAAELAVRAVSATPPDAVEDLHRRRVTAAQYVHASGDTARAITMVENALRETSAGDARAELLWTLGNFTYRGVDRRRAIAAFRQALDEVGEDAPLKARILESLSLGGSARMDEFAASERYARDAVAAAERGGDPATLARALARLGSIHLFRTGEVAFEIFDRAVALEESLGGPELDDGPAAVYAWALFSASRFERARERYEPLCERGRMHGDPAVASAIQILAKIEFHLGNWARAEELAREAHELAVQTGREAGTLQPLLSLAIIEAARGNVEAARAICLQAEATTDGSWWGGAAALSSLELSLENYEAAYELVRPVADLYHGLGVLYIDEELDAVEALAGLGRIDDGKALLAPIEDVARTAGSEWTGAAVARARGLLAAAADDLEAGERALEEATQLGSSVRDPLQLGRSLLALGTIRRRLRQKQAARDTLNRALETFEGLGARIWAERARRELARIGGRSAPRSELSATEAEIAGLVGAGRSNQEVAAALHLSPKTVEWNLSKIYRKLGVNSRTEMAAKLAARG